MIKKFIVVVVATLVIASEVAAGCTVYTCSKGQVTATRVNGVWTYGCTDGGYLKAVYYPGSCPSGNT